MFIIFFALFCINLIFAAEEVQPKEESLKKRLTVFQKKRNPTVRLKDIVQLQGIRTNYLVGYGLVVGLPGTGDTAMGSPNTRESVISMLERSGVNVREFANKFAGKSVASVMVTATLPSFARQGTHIDVTVSSLGDAKDLKGGTLIVTSLMGADGDVYAVAQGTIMTSAISAEGRATSITKGVPTSGKIPCGAIIEKEIGFEFKDLPFHRIILTNPDCTTSSRVAETINKKFNGVATALDPTTIELKIPKSKDKFQFLTEIETLEVTPDQKAIIVINQNEGVIVINDKVTISPAAVMHGSLTVKIMEVPQVVPATIIESSSGFVAPSVLATQTYTDSVEKREIEKQNAEIKILKEIHKKQLDSLKLKQSNDKANFELYNPNAIEKEKNDFKQEQDKERRHLVLNQNEQIENTLQKQRSRLRKINTNVIGKPEPQVVSATVVDNTKIDVQEEKGLFASIGGTSLEDLISALNDIGANVKVIAAILNSLKSAGAIQAEIIVI